ncbi:MAG: FeoB small GTPase domain-containing protein [Bacillota bacterium]|jgi:Fe2+ transport system protein B|nr:FeoB small GTPase domain-containing protein [Bacillota bacterium]
MRNESASIERESRTVGRRAREAGELVVALAGNPNTGKSTLFNVLTGLRQHTGNWPGKTVEVARGYYRHRGKRITLVDLPGNYSLLANSPEEEVARDFLCFAQPGAVVVVVDATCLERNLNLVLQVTEITPRMAVCLNLIDEARRRGIELDCTGLAEALGVPVVPTSARRGKGLQQLKDTIDDILTGVIRPAPRAVCYDAKLEACVRELERELAGLLDGRFSPRWVALRLISGDHEILKRIKMI